ncbi:MAG: glycoside hydrolase family 5 protein, partial [Candidatus Bathyarchaeota archaeon]|nr:glycoside hydrolase family 5 protein [Candidatus Bathyarchaeota archaeon]
MHVSLNRVLALCLVCLTITWPFALSPTVNSASVTPALHTSGHQILDTANNTVYFRGIGRTGDLQSASGMWSGPGDAVAVWSQKWQSISNNLLLMDETLQCYHQYWNVNLIRILIPVDWWWIDNVTSITYQSTAVNITISYRAYIETLVAEASKYGIYVDFCPYSAVNTYLYSGSWEGEPITGWVSGTASASFIKSVTSGAGRTEMQFWEQWWTSVFQRIGFYPNVILEMWNEPGESQSAYFSYMIDMYQTIRSLGCQNLIFMQWNMGLIPTVSELNWVPLLYNQLSNATGSPPVNVVFTTHPYRYSPSPNTQWATTYSSVKSQLNLPNMVPITRSSNCDVPLVFNEMGVCQSVCDSAEYSFWDAILHCALDLGIGVCPYYWISDADLGPVYCGESLVAGSWVMGAQSPTPNTVGQTFLNYASVLPAPPPSNMTLTVSVNGNGVTNPPAGVNSYPAYTVVTLTATPNAGSSFDHWELFSPQGYDYGPSFLNPEWLTMDQNYLLQAYFKTNPTPSPTRTPTPSPTPRPSVTPTPTPSPSSTPRPTPTATPSPTPTPTPSPNPYLFTANFETGNFSEYAGVSGVGTHSETVEKANPYLGVYDAKFTASASSGGWVYQSISSSAITYYRQLVKVGSMPPSSGRYLYFGSIQSKGAQNTVAPFIYGKSGQYYWGVLTVINGVGVRVGVTEGL